MKDHKITVMFLVNRIGVGGAEIQLLELIRGMDKTHFEPVLVSVCSGGNLEQAARNIPGVEYVTVNRKGKYDFWVIARIFSLLRRKKVDVIHPLQTPSIFLGLLPAILCRTPVKIVTERSAERKSSFGASLYQKAEDFLSRFADWAVPNSEAGANFLIKRHYNPGRIRVIYNGLNLSRLDYDREGVAQIRRKMGVPPEGKAVGMLARLTTHKDHNTYLQAAAMINKSVPDTRFGLIGDGPLKSELENLARELGIISKTTFFGDQKDVGIHLSALDVAVLTSRTEGCSNSLLEAMAVGRPVVANDVGGNRELVRHGKTGYLVPFGDAEAIAAAVLSLINDPEKARVMGQRAKEDILERFSMEKMVQHYQSLYEESLRSKARRI